jgi:hypothetical protein
VKFEVQTVPTSPMLALRCQGIWNSAAGQQLFFPGVPEMASELLALLVYDSGEQQAAPHP